MVIGPGPAGLKFWTRPLEQITEISGPLVETEDGDIANSTGMVEWIGTLSVTELVDAAAAAGPVTKTFFNPARTAASLVLSNTNLTATLAGPAPVTGTLAALEAADTASMTDAVATSWTPADLPGLVAWYKATDGVYHDTGTTLATNGQTVQQWNDQSGHGYHLFPVSGHEPTFNTAGFNSNPAIMFSNSTNTTALMTANDTVVMGTGIAGSGFVVGQVLSATHDIAAVLGYLGNGDAAQFAVFSTGGASFINKGGDSSPTIRTWRASNACDLITVGYGTNYRFGSIFDASGNNTIYLNGVAQTPASLPGSLSWTSPGTIIVGACRADPLACWEGPVAEIVLTNTALSSDDRLNLDNYFKAKWGL